MALWDYAKSGLNHVVPGAGYVADFYKKVGTGESGITMFDKPDSVQTPQPDANGYLYGGTSAADEQALRARLATQMRAADQRQLDWRAADQSRDNSMAVRQQQSGLAQSYQQQISGQGPSVAREQLYAGQERNAQQQQAIAAGARGGGGNVLAAQRMAQQQAALSGQATNRDAAMLRAQETAAAMQGQSGLLNGMRQGDVAQGQQDQQRQVQQTQLNDSRNQFYAAQMEHAYDQKMAGSTAYQQSKVNAEQRTAEFNAGLDERDKQSKRKMVGDAANNGAAVGMIAGML